MLLTTVGAWELGGTTFVEDHLRLLAGLLEGDDVDVRAAAGEAVALLFDACDLASLPQSAPAADADDEEGMPQRLEDIVARMQDLARNRGDDTRRSKKDRASLRGTFRELCSIVEVRRPTGGSDRQWLAGGLWRALSGAARFLAQGGEIPEQKVKLRHGDVLVVDTLAGNIQLNAFRSFLGDGFQPHLQHNSLLHDVFNYRPREEQQERLTAKEKRMFRSPASAESKGRSQQRKQERQMMSAYKGGLIH